VLSRFEGAGFLFAIFDGVEVVWQHDLVWIGSWIFSPFLFFHLALYVRWV